MVARILVASTPLHGHVSPLLGAASELVARGHEVTFLTGSRFAAAVAGTGAHPVALPPGADFDDRDLDAALPRGRSAGRLAKINLHISRLLADPLPHQFGELRRLDEEWRPHAVLVDTTFLGALAWRAATPDGPPLAVANITYLAIAGEGVPPPGPGLPPAAGRRGERRDAAVRWVTDHVVARAGLAQLDRVCAATIGRRLPGLLFDGPLLADRVFVLTVPSFEYSRADLPERIRFVGPVFPPGGGPFEPPGWWSDLDGRRPVVHVTQGTFDNADLGRLIAPALKGLAGEDVLVVATTGGPPATTVPGSRPANARVAEFLAYEHLLPKVDVMVTNGGFGGVQRALSLGIPLVVAGAGEDKPEIAARVAWSGAGVNLRTGRPRPAAVRAAVRRVLHEPSFRARARALQAEMDCYDGVRALADGVAEMAASCGPLLRRR